MACLHETRTPSPSFGSFNTILAESSLRKLDPDASDCTPEKDLTPTQCVLRDVLPIDGGGGGGSGHSPTPSEETHDQFANSVLQLHENEAGGGGGSGAGAGAGAGIPEVRPTRYHADQVRIQTGSGFLEGLFGCLKPVWTMIGKAYSTEHKQQQEGKLGAPWVVVSGKWAVGKLHSFSTGTASDCHQTGTFHSNYGAQSELANGGRVDFQEEVTAINLHCHLAWKCSETASGPKGNS